MIIMMMLIIIMIDDDTMMESDGDNKCIQQHIKYVSNYHLPSRPVEYDHLHLEAPFIRIQMNIRLGIKMELVVSIRAVYTYTIITLHHNYYYHQYHRHHFHHHYHYHHHHFLQQHCHHHHITLLGLRSLYISPL